jgi:hypothetical protein
VAWKQVKAERQAKKSSVPAKLGADIRAMLRTVKAMKTGRFNLRIDEFCE